MTTRVQAVRPTWAAKQVELDDAALLGILRIVIGRLQEADREAVTEYAPPAARQARRETHRAINRLAEASDVWDEVRNRADATPMERQATMVEVGKARELAATCVADWYRAEPAGRKGVVQPFLDLLTGGFA